MRQKHQLILLIALDFHSTESIKNILYCLHLFHPAAHQAYFSLFLLSFPSQFAFFINALEHRHHLPHNYQFHLISSVISIFFHFFFLCATMLIKKKF